MQMQRACERASTILTHKDEQRELERAGGGTAACAPAGEGEAGLRERAPPARELRPAGVPACLPGMCIIESLQRTEHRASLIKEARSSSHACFTAAAAISSAQYLARLTHAALCSAQELLQYTVQACDSDCEEEDVSDGADWPSTP